MSRTAAALLTAALLLTAPGAVLAKGDGGSTDAAPAPRAGKAEPATPEPEARKERQEDLRALPIYIPPSRGSLPTRVGGGSRGGPQPGRRL